jgi:hypothetical protein
VSPVGQVKNRFPQVDAGGGVEGGGWVPRQSVEQPSSETLLPSSQSSPGSSSPLPQSSVGSPLEPSTAPNHVAGTTTMAVS